MNVWRFDGGQLRAMRIRAGVSTAEAARRLSGLLGRRIARQTYEGWEGRHVPRASLLGYLAAVVGCQVTELGVRVAAAAD